MTIHPQLRFFFRRGVQADEQPKQTTPTMNTHQINAAHNGFHWTIAFDSDGNVAERDIRISNDLYTLFECDCGAEFDTKREAISHLTDIDTAESGEAVRRFSIPAEQ
jgi:hypothetical protein